MKGLCVMIVEASSDDIIKWSVNPKNTSGKPTQNTLVLQNLTAQSADVHVSFRHISLQFLTPWCILEMVKETVSNNSIFNTLLNKVLYLVKRIYTTCRSVIFYTHKSLNSVSWLTTHPVFYQKFYRIKIIILHKEKFLTCSLLIKFTDNRKISADNGQLSVHNFVIQPPNQVNLIPV